MPKGTETRCVCVCWYVVLHAVSCDHMCTVRHALAAVTHFYSRMLSLEKMTSMTLI